MRMRLAGLAGLIWLAMGSDTAHATERLVNGWKVVTTTDAMTDAKVCRARKGQAQIKILSDRSIQFLVDYRDIGNLAFYLLRFDEDPVGKDMWDAADDDVAMVPAGQIDRLMTAKRLRVRGFDTSTRMIDRDIDLSGMQEVLAILRGPACI